MNSKKDFGRFTYFGRLWSYEHVWSTTDPPSHGTCICFHADGAGGGYKGESDSEPTPEEMAQAKNLLQLNSPEVLGVPLAHRAAARRRVIKQWLREAVRLGSILFKETRKAWGATDVCPRVGCDGYLDEDRVCRTCGKYSD